LTPLFQQLTHADVEKVMRLVEILHQSNLEFIRIEAQGMEITIAKGDAAKPEVHVASSVAAARGVAIPAPGVGVFRANGVRVGSLVAEAAALGTIQTLDEMNTVTAGLAGKIVEGCVHDGDFVEFGQPLYRILPQG
jgi:acetyl-CoA carboxylase biotin carboxyl carrier protein